MAKPTGTREQHPTYGALIRYPVGGLGCADCGEDPHEGPCREYTCADCGTVCGESGCSQHPRARVRLHTISRREAES